MIKRSIRFTTATFVYILFTIGILIFINFISWRHHRRFDLTKNKQFSLSSQTLQVLKNLPDQAAVKAFFKKGEEASFRYKDLLDEYVYNSKKFSYELIDPDRNPVLAKNYGIEEYGTSILLYQDKTERFTGIDEEDLTNAILKVTRKEVKKIYFLSGHGEADIEESGEKGYAEVKKALGQETYLVEKLVLAQAEAVPQDAVALVVAGPKKALFPVELDKLKDYINKGGSVFFMLDPDGSSELKNFVKEWNIEVGDDIIIDRLSKLFGAGYTTPVITQYESHEITRKFKYATFFPMARSVKPGPVQKSGYNVISLAKTSPSSWAEVDYKTETVEYNEGKDTAGPVSVGVAAEITTTSSRIVTFGDSDFAGNQFLPLSGNRDLFLNTVNWLAKEENLITIRPKEAEASRVSLTRRDGLNLFFISVVAYPLALLVIGITVWYRRR